MVDNSDRIRCIDLLKSLAIIFVIIGHCAQILVTGGGYEPLKSNYVYKAIYLFHMPLFIFISGYLFYPSIQKKELKPLYLSCYKMIKTAIIWGIVAVIFEIIIFSNYNISVINIIKEVAGKYWFLWAIVVYRLPIILSRQFDRRITTSFLIVLVMAISAIHPNRGIIYQYAIYFYLGYCISSLKKGTIKRIIISRSSSAVLVVSCFFIVIVEFLYLHSSLWASDTLLNFFRAIKSMDFLSIIKRAFELFGGYIVVFLFIIALFVIGNELSRKIEGCFAKITLEIYLVQGMVVEIFEKKLVDCIITNPNIKVAVENNVLLRTLSLLLLAVIGSTISIFCAKKIKQIDKRRRFISR